MKKITILILVLFLVNTMLVEAQSSRPNIQIGGKPIAVPTPPGANPKPQTSNIPQVQQPAPPPQTPATTSPTYTKNAAGQVNVQAPILKFSNYEMDFGEVPTKTKIPYHFVFQNTGTMPLIIEGAWASCDCTDVYWPVTPIPPGETASIHLIYDSRNNPGEFFRTITFRANTLDKTHKLFIKGKVVEGLNPASYQLHEEIKQ